MKRLKISGNTKDFKTFKKLWNSWRFQSKHVHEYFQIELYEEIYFTYELGPTLLTNPHKYKGITWTKEISWHKKPQEA